MPEVALITWPKQSTVRQGDNRKQEDALWKAEAYITYSLARIQTECCKFTETTVSKVAGSQYSTSATNTVFRVYDWLLAIVFLFKTKIISSDAKLHPSLQPWFSSWGLFLTLIISGTLKNWFVTPCYSQLQLLRVGVGGVDVYLSTGPQVVDDSLDSVHHLQSHLLFLRPRGDVIVEVIDLLV